jgi:ABC-type nitrate/sulfonate/bicarbonate transport system ATPase subunit
MRADLVRIWQRERKTVLFVTHDIDEAIQLADRIVVLSSRPANDSTRRHDRLTPSEGSGFLAVLTDTRPDP